MICSTSEFMPITFSRTELLLSMSKRIISVQRAAPLIEVRVRTCCNPRCRLIKMVVLKQPFFSKGSQFLRGYFFSVRRICISIGTHTPPLVKRNASFSKFISYCCFNQLRTQPCKCFNKMICSGEWAVNTNQSCALDSETWS